MALVPSFRGPGYAADMGGLIDAVTKSGTDRTVAELKARSDALRASLGNAKDIAAIGGSGALGNLLTGPGGLASSPFDTPYATNEDTLRTKTEEANIGRLNRVGVPHAKSGGSGGKPKTSDATVTFDDGSQIRVTASAVPDIDYASQNGGKQIAKVEYGIPVAGGGATNNAPAPAAATGDVTDNGDGTWTLSDGTIIDENGTPQ